jgi:succinyl-CoA synthetase alpha subunit
MPPVAPSRWPRTERENEQGTGQKQIMSIFLDENSKVVYQGLTGSQGRYYGLLNRDYGTNVVAGTSPKKAGTDVEGIPVFATVGDAREATGANVSCIFIPAPGVKAAVLEAAEAGIELIVCITEGVPAHDEAYFFSKLKRDFPNTRLLGPNCPGLISPGKANVGITAGHIAKPGGPVGIVSRSGTLTYQALYELKQKDIGVTTCVGIGGDPVPGTSFIDCLAAFEADPETKAVMMIGEIGGSAEEEAAEFIKDHMTKPVSSYVAGVTAPPGKKMGHAGAIVSGGKGTAAAKMDALRDAGVLVGTNPTEAGELMAEIVAGL